MRMISPDSTSGARLVNFSHFLDSILFSHLARLISAGNPHVLFYTLIFLGRILKYNYNISNDTPLLNDAASDPKP